ncbi:MAG TPA: DNA polymerase III subunit alpha, partial [Thermodesulfobacteriota bacterium]|nr:DNA polymerase III subunit alpha [Thermodesulfobacteriota bacterium]
MHGQRFIHLHVHSYYTFMAGTASPDALCRRAKELGYEALALTDTNGLYGLPEFLSAAKQYDLMPLVGAHVCTSDSRAVLLAKNAQGYQCMCRLLTKLHHHTGSFSLLDELKQGFSNCVLLSPDLSLLSALQDAEDMFVELVPDAGSLATFKAARRLGIPAIATGAVYFLDAGDRELHRMLRAINRNTTLDLISPDECALPHAWLKDPEAMSRHFPYAPEALENTVRIAETLQQAWETDGEVFPEWEGSICSADALRVHCHEGLKKRYGSPCQKAIDRLNQELDLICAKGFAGYFLIVADIVSRFPITCGRGSAAASLVSYCLGITHVDPIEHNLLFSRFLNEGRSDLPDIDVDFPWDERDQVVTYVRRRFGEEHVAAVATVTGFRSRAAVCEVAKVFGMPDHEIRKVTRRLSSYAPATEIVHRVQEHPLFAGFELPEPWPSIFAWASRLEGVPRHLGTHCGGIVVTPDALARHVPVQVSAKRVPLIQWDKDGAEDRGLVKMDLLGNRTLAVIRDTLEAIKNQYGISISYDQFNPLHDHATQELIRSGQTMGVFYVESPAMRRLLRMADQGDYHHLIALSSIIRPAANRFILEYVRRLKGGAWKPLHPAIEEILAETFGVMVYQEDIARIAMMIAGFSEAEADMFRRIVTGRIRNRVSDQKERFYRGASGRGVSRSVIDALWEMISSFSGYSFCKPHSASYALVSFKAAYLKSRFPSEFIAAVLSNGGGFYAPRAYISEAVRMGITILSPDVAVSDNGYTGSGTLLRVGLSAIKGLSWLCREGILEERAKQQFTSFVDFMMRVRPTQPDALLLLKAGALDSLSSKLGRIGMAWYIRAH